MDAIVEDVRGPLPPVIELPAPAWLRRGMWLGGLLLAVALLVIFRFDPAQHALYPRCYFHAATGLDCPGCGGLRATHQLLHGNFAAAFALNPLAPLLPVFALAWLGFRAARVQVPVWLRAWWPAWLIGGLLVFGIARNMPQLVSFLPGS